MIKTAALMIVASGAAHAVVNAILKSGKDKMSSRALIDGFSAILILPFAILLPRPDGAWAWLAGSGITHLLYLICLVKAFEHGDMSTAYPISRGTAPVLAAIGAVTLLGAPISAPVVAGVLLVSLGALMIALWRGPAFILAARSQWKPGLVAGALGIVTYGLALMAYGLGDVPRLAALRETSILFGVGIAVVFLKEKVSRLRTMGALTIAAGAVVLLALG